MKTPASPGKPLARPGVMAALADVESGRSAGILIAKLGRPSRSLADFVNLMARAQSGRWNIVALT